MLIASEHCTSTSVIMPKYMKNKVQNLKQNDIVPVLDSQRSISKVKVNSQVTVVNRQWPSKS